ncbi:MAG: Na+-dependent transporter [Clostridia bacterium]|jgi:NSS family neurotransmitter:Na+ symporter|nr:Na+-dependent transporter [Clostridia bacterium]
MNNRSEFSSKLGFVLAAAGSAVGLGNIWRFPYLAAKYGGGLFLLMYVFFVVTFGFAIMTAEIAIGRKTQLSPIGAYTALNKKYGFIGVIASLVAFLILPYYSVIGGWVIKYFVTFLTGGQASTAQDTFFTSFIASPIEPVLWQILFVLATLAVVLKGVKDGIEKASKILMPVLIVLSVVVAIYSITLPGAMEGVKYFLIPDFSRFSIQSVLAALGQMFYSLSLAMGIMITYGSYLKKEDDLEKSVKQIELFDSGIAILAGFMVIPAVFAFSGGDEAALNAGPGLMFVTLPKVFNTMGMSTLVGSAFFLLVLFAALTSSISLMEAVVSTVCDQFKLERKKASILVAVTAVILGIPSSLGNGIWSEFKILNMNFLDLMDFITNAVLMPIGALLTCIFIGYVIKVKVISDEVKISSKFKREKVFTVMIKYIAPMCIVAILVTSVLSALGLLTL